MILPVQFRMAPAEPVPVVRQRNGYGSARASEPGIRLRWRRHGIPKTNACLRIVHQLATTLLPALTFAVVVNGCKVGPDYQTPKSTLPTGYASKVAISAPANSAAPGEGLARWWLQFNDSQLDTLIAEAGAANHDLRLAQARVKEARALRGGVRSSLFPQVDAAGAYQRSRTSENTYQGQLLQGAGVGVTQDNWQSGLDLNWELDVFGGTRRSVEATQAGLEAAEDSANGTRIAVLAEVGLSYLDLRGLQKQLAVAQNNLRGQEQTLTLTRDRFQAGLANELDTARAEAQVAATAASLPPLEQGILRAQHRIAVLLGKAPGELANQLNSTASIPTAAPTVPVGLPSDLLRRRPDIRRAERELAAATARIGVATAELFPKFYLTGAAGLQSLEAEDFFEGGSKFWSLGPTFRWPIFSAGKIRQNIRVENARQEQALIRYEQTVLTSLEEVENALVGFGKEQERYRELAKSEVASRRAVTLANDQFRSGLVDFLSVLEAERTLFLAQEQLVRSEQLLSQNAVRLYKALGGGWQEPLKREMIASAATGPANASMPSTR